MTQSQQQQHTTASSPSLLHPQSQSPYPYTNQYRYPSQYPSSSQALQSQSPQNKQLPPVANAGISQTVNENTKVTLDTDVKPPPPTSQIIQQPGPPRVQLPLPPTFAQPCVNNGTNVLGPKDNGKQILNQENQCTGTPTNVNQAPIANAGPDQTVSQGSLVTLDGTGSHATTSGATIVSYIWVQISGIPVTLSGSNTATPTFVAHSNSTIVSFSLTVADSTGAVSSPSTVTISVP